MFDGIYVILWAQLHKVVVVDTKSHTFSRAFRVNKFCNGGGQWESWKFNLLLFFNETGKLLLRMPRNMHWLEVFFYDYDQENPKITFQQIPLPLTRIYDLIPALLRLAGEYSVAVGFMWFDLLPVVKTASA